MNMTMPVQPSTAYHTRSLPCNLLNRYSLWDIHEVIFILIFVKCKSNLRDVFYWWSNYPLQLISEIDGTTWHFFERVRFFSEGVYQKLGISQAHVQKRVLQTTISLFMEPFDILNTHPTADTQITQHHYFLIHICVYVCKDGTNFHEWYI